MNEFQHYADWRGASTREGACAPVWTCIRRLWFESVNRRPATAHGRGVDAENDGSSPIHPGLRTRPRTTPGRSGCSSAKRIIFASASSLISIQAILRATDRAHGL